MSRFAFIFKLRELDGCYRWRDSPTRVYTPAALHNQFTGRCLRYIDRTCPDGTPIYTSPHIGSYLHKLKRKITPRLPKQTLLGAHTLLFVTWLVATIKSAISHCWLVAGCGYWAPIGYLLTMLRSLYDNSAGVCNVQPGPRDILFIL